MSEGVVDEEAETRPAIPELRIVEVRVPAPELDYCVRIAAGLLTRLGEELRAVCPAARRVALVSDENVMPLHGPGVRRSLEAAGLTVLEWVVPAGERSKTPARAIELIEAMVAGNLARHDVVVALGGGVIGDLAGVAAALFMRGIDLVHCPTSLLAQVDASVGGKVAVDLPAGKNLLGAFHFPKLVLTDPKALATLPPRELACGLAEMLKHGAVFSRRHFDEVVDAADRVFDGDVATVTSLLSASIALKAACVGGDPRELSGVAGGRALLNFGHTIGHAIEQVSNFEVRHGEAVGLGMIAAARLSDLRAASRKAPDGAGRLETTFVAALTKLRLPTDLDTWLAADRRDAITSALLSDKKRTTTHLSYIALAEIAAPEFFLLEAAEIVALLRSAPRGC